MDTKIPVLRYAGPIGPVIHVVVDRHRHSELRRVPTLGNSAGVAVLVGTTARMIARLDADATANGLEARDAIDATGEIRARLERSFTLAAPALVPPTPPSTPKTIIRPEPKTDLETIFADPVWVAIRLDAAPERLWLDADGMTHRNNAQLDTNDRFAEALALELGAPEMVGEFGTDESGAIVMKIFDRIDTRIAAKPYVDRLRASNEVITKSGGLIVPAAITKDADEKRSWLAGVLDGHHHQIRFRRLDAPLSAGAELVYGIVT